MEEEVEKTKEVEAKVVEAEVVDAEVGAMRKWNKGEPDQLEGITL